MRYILFHKPYGVVSQFSGEGPTLGDFVKLSGVYSVGRLDKDSEGLMLLTDDGPLQHRFTDPKFEHPRTYWVQVEGVPDDRALKRLREGVEIQGYRTKRARVRLIEPNVPPRDPPVRFRKSIPTSWLKITLVEGRNRQVRHMTAAVGFPTLRLIRVAIGNLRLEGLRPGELREISKPV
jgi:23S rRNA pseudouridine2457 synthase